MEFRLVVINDSVFFGYYRQVLYSSTVGCNPLADDVTRRQ